MKNYMMVAIFDSKDGIIFVIRNPHVAHVFISR